MRRTLPWTEIKAFAHNRLLLLKRSEAGFSLIELLVSALLLVSIGAATAEALIATTYISGDQRRHSQAAQVAQDDQERIRGLSVAQLNSLNQASTRTVTVAGTAYTVTSTTKFLNNTGGPSCIPGAAAYFQIVTAVDWSSNKRGPVVTESIIAPPAGGTIRATVRDQTALPNSGVPGVAVSATGPDVETAPTDTTGCAVLSGLPAGTYNVTYAKPGFVDPNGLASPPNVTATVTSTGNSTPSPDPVYMGLAGTFTATFQAFVGINQTDTGEADYLSWYGAGGWQSMDNSNYAPATAAGVATTLGSAGLYPFAFTGPSYASNYQVWAGKCRQMQPPPGIGVISVAPGSTQAVTVHEPELDLFVYNGAPTRIKPSHVKMTFTSTTGPGCTDTWQPTIDQVNPTTSTHGVLINAGQPFFTSTSTSAPQVSASGYTGTMSVCVDNGSRYKKATPVNYSYAAVTPVNIDLSSGTTNGTC